MNKKNITLIATGGTIAKTYAQDNLVNHLLMIDEITAKLQMPAINIEFVDLIKIDSKDMTDELREKIALEIKKVQAHNSPVIITHGTDTMVDTGIYLQKYFTNKPESVNSPIILTGAMLPYSMLGSDAVQNITEALLAAQFLPAGFYIVCHNQILPLPNVRKDYELLTFVSTNDNKNG